MSQDESTSWITAMQADRAALELMEATRIMEALRTVRCQEVRRKIDEETAKSEGEEMSHTPGPWRACRDGNCPCRQVWSIPGDVPVFTARGNSQALIGLAHHKWGDDAQHIYGEIPLSETQDNAILIQAAPDLLEAAKLTVLHFKRNKAWLGDDDHEAWSALEKAIDKAEGKTK